MSRTIYQGREFIVEIFVENGHKRTFLDNLVNDYNAKKKNHDSRSYTGSKKSHEKLILEQKLENNLNRKTKTIFSHLPSIYKAFYVKKPPKLLPNSHPGA